MIENCIMTKINLTASDSTIFIDGAIVRAELDKDFLHQANKYFNKDNVTIDLSKVGKVDTAGLAWLLSLVEYANKHSFTVQFQHFPNDLITLAKLSAVDLFLPRA